MPTTTPDNIFFADGATPMSAEDISAAQASSVQAALIARTTTKVADLAALAALSGTFVSGDMVYVAELGAYFRRDSLSNWEQVTLARFTTIAARDAAYAKAGGAYLNPSVARAYCSDVDREFIYYTNADNPRVPVNAWCSTSIIRMRKIGLGLNPIPTTETAIATAFGEFAIFGPGVLDVHFGGTMQLNTAMGASIYVYTGGTNRQELRFEKANAGVDKHSLAALWSQVISSAGQVAAQIDLAALASEPTASILTNVFWDATFTPAWMTGS